MIKFRNLYASEIEVRVGQKFQNGKVSLLLYQDGRCAMNLLDETVKPENWSCNYSRQGESLFCSIGIYVKEHNAFIFKADAGAESNFEKTKGEASDAFKRAAVKWGIGRSLYTAPKIIVPCDNEYETFKVAIINYDDNDRIVDLEIMNSKDQVIFAFHNGTIQRNQSIPPEEILKTVCGELKEAGEDYKELIRFYNYYKERIAGFNNVNANTIRNLWNKWNKNNY